eukprot:CAMPEP_0185165868 /NCGR_PEP_ID=MMETSP1139-20130426/11584_1 /TAXON_ID=298111 /ORGANISM="Pavlova sp., Strain CCMP459" /LENGTH=74 /DNA_ID=CAMNT_0027731289 /DNA_START=137 /DNA_END=361 /DNA_ORIENTATION=-
MPPAVPLVAVAAWVTADVHLPFLVRLPLCDKAVPQPGKEDAFGFLPLCTRLCLARLPLSEKPLPLPGKERTRRV